MNIKFSTYLTIVFAAIIFSAVAMAQSGGSFTLQQTVVAGGGSTSSVGGNFRIEGTSGQAAAGVRSNVSPLSLQNGFWTAAPLTPTAAEVSISGRIMTADGTGIRNISVTLAEANGGIRTVLSGSFGYYRFDGVLAGQTVVIRVSGKRYIFPQPAQLVVVNDETGEINFIAN